MPALVQSVFREFAPGDPVSTAIANPTSGNTGVVIIEHRSGGDPVPSVSDNGSGSAWTQKGISQVEQGDATYRRGIAVYTKDFTASDTDATSLDASFAGSSQAFWFAEFSDCPAFLEAIFSDNGATADEKSLATDISSSLDANSLQVAYFGIKMNSSNPTGITIDWDDATLEANKAQNLNSTDEMHQGFSYILDDAGTGTRSYIANWDEASTLNYGLLTALVVFGTASAGISAEVTGTATASIDEADIVTGGKTVIITLTNDTFVTGTSSEDGIAAGSDSDVVASGTNWDSLIKTDLDNADVVISTTTVTNDTATITLPAYATYDPGEQEEITWTIPAASLTTSGSPLVATPTFTVDLVSDAQLPAGSLSMMGVGV